MTTIPIYSHITQKLLNYFPYTDVRIRENPVSLGAQLLNAVAYQMESQQQRINREVRSLNLAEVPMNIDNGGVYYSTVVPLSFALSYDSQGNLLPPSSIIGEFVPPSPITGANIFLFVQTVTYLPSAVSDNVNGDYTMVPTTAANGDNIDPFLDKIHLKINTGIIKLDPHGPNSGPINTKWGIRINIPLGDIS